MRARVTVSLVWCLAGSLYSLGPRRSRGRAEYSVVGRGAAGWELLGAVSGVSILALALMRSIHPGIHLGDVVFTFSTSW
ncbi:hypothetical protein C7974DRAFT_27036 [Boeremia exigua]|uniref:uncharacterized protein n=1 Tax=Boeremia exigua TaxID=749465 RepID=UPI001E8DE057|nr:uncharacterized protein C7974DRAFT_27036 [Boeremia exigua]KAH6644743.1 hypothetical protein C7974DRAFT_27036 [Boeremia exigua]